MSVAEAQEKFKLIHALLDGGQIPLRHEQQKTGKREKKRGVKNEKKTGTEWFRTVPDADPEKVREGWKDIAESNW